MFRLVEERLASLQRAYAIVRGGYEKIVASCGQSSVNEGSWFVRVGDVLQEGPTLEVAMGAVAHALATEVTRREEDLARMRVALSARGRESYAGVGDGSGGGAVPGVFRPGGVSAGGAGGPEGLGGQVPDVRDPVAAPVVAVTRIQAPKGYVWEPAGPSSSAPAAVGGNAGRQGVNGEGDKGRAAVEGFARRDLGGVASGDAHGEEGGDNGGVRIGEADTDPSNGRVQGGASEGVSEWEVMCRCGHQKQWHPDEVSAEMRATVRAAAWWCLGNDCSCRGFESAGGPADGKPKQGMVAKEAAAVDRVLGSAGAAGGNGSNPCAGTRAGRAFAARMLDAAAESFGRCAGLDGSSVGGAAGGYHPPDAPSTDERRLGTPTCEVREVLSEREHPRCICAGCPGCAIGQRGDCEGTDRGAGLNDLARLGYWCAECSKYRHVKPEGPKGPTASEQGPAKP